jgi:large subunit ribosomal protein L30
MSENSAAPEKTIKITLVKGVIGYNQAQKDTVRALGLRKMHQTVEKPDNPAIRGMINAVRHLVVVSE